MTPIKFILRYTAVPFMAIVAVVSWALLHSSAEIDARQYAALSGAYASFPVDLRRDIGQALQSGRLSKRDYSSLVRESLDDGVISRTPRIRSALRILGFRLITPISESRPK
jgi:hypothetical protein